MEILETQFRPYTLDGAPVRYKTSYTHTLEQFSIAHLKRFQVVEGVNIRNSEQTVTLTQEQQTQDL